MRTHRHLCLDCDIVNAVFDEETSSSLKINPHALTQLLEHIHKTPEIAVTLSSTDFTVKSHSHTSSAHSSSLSTAITLALDEFETADIRHSFSVSLVFTYKELKALLALCDACDNNSFVFYYTTSGRPVKCVANELAAFSVQLVIATMEAEVPPSVDASDVTTGQKRSFEDASAGRASNGSSSSSVSVGKRSGVSHLRRIILDDDEDSTQS